MATLHLLGTGAAVSDPHRTTTMLAVENDASLVVIDCGGDAVQRLMAAGVNVAKLSALIITHEHADHVSGFPLFMEKVWLLGRRDPVPVYGIAPALAQARRLHDSFDLSDWKGYPGVRWLEVAHRPNAKVLQDGHWMIRASPGKHAVDVIGLHITSQDSGTSVAYSCDTEFSETIVALAKGANVLVHEATGAFPGHTTASEAAQAAMLADVERLLLVHLPPETGLTDRNIAEAQALFRQTEKGVEGGRYEF